MKMQNTISPRNSRLKRVWMLILLAMTLAGAQQGVQAQQDAQYSQYMFNQLVYNPAYTG
ncbi:MAG: type IX secretion system membrane protein PorP/SprF, partial [Bacteroidia bacterium]|nr:type IX secretion system membrane protein PorP/SprF [Bacteroidia bacterium]